MRMQGSKKGNTSPALLHVLQKRRESYNDVGAMSP
jgi:hypothetical protein